MQPDKTLAPRGDLLKLVPFSLSQPFKNYVTQSHPVVGSVASRGSPAPGCQCLDRRLDRRPPPPRLVNPASAPGGKIGSQHESSGPIAFAPLKFTPSKFAPTSWAGAPSKACARGPWPPLPPPPSVRHCVGSQHNGS